MRLIDFECRISNSLRHGSKPGTYQIHVRYFQFNRSQVRVKAICCVFCVFSTARRIRRFP